MVQRYETIISAREEGFARTAQEVLSGSRQIAQAMEMLQRIGSGSVTPGAGAFAGVTPEEIGATVRQYDVLMRKMSELRRAELAQTRMEKRLAIPEGKTGHVASPELRQEMRLRAAERIDRASEGLVKVLNAEAAERLRGLDQIRKNRDLINQDHYKRVQAEDRALAAQERAAAEAERQAKIYAASSTVPFASPDLSTRVGMAQAGVNSAERALAIATQGRAALYERGNATATQMLRADQALDGATKALAVARQRLAREESHVSHSTNLIGRTRDQFMSGFRGQSDMPYAQQIGQAFKFSVFYGTAYKLLFALTTTLTATLQEGIKFEQAMTELKIASGASADAANEMAQGLSRQATAAGQAPSVGIEIGARSLGLFGATDAAGATQTEQQRVMDLSARTVSRMALGSDLPIAELQTQLGAVANAFGGGAAGQIRAADLDAYLGRQFSVQQGQILQAVAEAANVGQAAGFDQEQVSAIAGAMISRTGQSPSTASGWMAQIFSRGGEGSLTALTERYGIDPNAKLADQLAALADIYKTAGDTERSEILAAGGRGKVQNAMEILIGGYDEIMAAADRSRTESRGEAERVSDLRLADIGGQLQLTVAAMQAFASELGKSGVLDILGAGVLAFRELTEAATGVLRAWNEIPGALKAAIGALALFTIAARTSAGAGALSMLGGLGGRSAASRGVNLGAVMAPYGGAVGSTGEPVRGAGGAAAARNLLSSAGPWIAAAAGLYAIGELVNTTRALADAEEDATDTLNALAEDNTPDAFRSRAAELQSRAKVSREAADGSWMNKVLPVLRGQADDARGDASEMEMEARRLEAAAKVVENAAADLNPARQGAITGFDEESLTSSLDAITRSGGSAADRLRALDEALQGTADSAAAFTPELFAAQQGENLVGLLGENITGITGKNMTPNAVRDALSGFGGSPESAIQNALFGAGVADAGDLNLSAADKVARELVAKTEGSASYVGTAEYENAVEVVRDFLMQKTRDARIMVDAAISLTPEEGILMLGKIMAESQGKRDNLQESDFRGLAGNSRRLVRRIQRTIDRTQGGGGEEMAVQLDLARRQMAEDQFNELENMRRAAQRAAKSKAEIAKIGQRFLRRELRAAIRGGNQDVLAQIIGQAGAGAVRIARQIIQEAIDAARAARAVYLQIQAVRREAQSVLGAEIEWARGGGALPDDAKVPDSIKKMQQALGDMQTAAPGEDVYTLGSDLPGYEAPKAKEKKSKEDRAAEREAARQEMLELKNNLYLLSIDLTDPLAQATAAVKDARRRLQSDIASGQDRNTIVASRLALRQAQNEREATAFQQRLDAITTAEELGRVSHRKYISYLQNERRRLNAIKDRTFQQQQQLDQIDRLMKDAADAMQGQWNFGDIKLPTPYQVRRQVEQMRLDRSTQLDATSRQVASQSTIYIDGADTGKVRQIINETLNKSNATVTNRPRRR